MTARCHPCPARRTVRACRGIALPFTLIALVVLLLAGVGLIRAMDVGLLQAGNLAFRRDQVIPNCECWGLFDGDLLLGFIAILPGWIDHLYVEPALHRCGIGSQLIAFAQARQCEIRLYTFQSNARGRAFYEHHGFVIEEMTDGARNEEKMPDITYLWRRA